MSYTVSGMPGTKLPWSTGTKLVHWDKRTGLKKKSFVSGSERDTSRKSREGLWITANFQMWLGVKRRNFDVSVRDRDNFKWVFGPLRPNYFLVIISIMLLTWIIYNSGKQNKLLHSIKWNKSSNRQSARVSVLMPMDLYYSVHLITFVRFWPLIMLQEQLLQEQLLQKH